MIVEILVPIYATLLGILIDCSVEHPEKALLPINYIIIGLLIIITAVYLPIYVILVGRSIDSSFEHPENAELPYDRIVRVGSVISVVSCDY